MVKAEIMIRVMALKFLRGIIRFYIGLLSAGIGKQSVQINN